MHRRAALTLALIVFSAAILSNCGKSKHTAIKHRGATPVSGSEVGLASWYGHPYHGRMAANGEIYDMEKPTAAHRTLPFGTWVRVTNLSNNKVTEVRITDRGPFIAGRIIDLSHSSAQAIDLIGPGVARVRIDVISAPAVAAALAARPRVEADRSTLYGVQVGVFRERERAETIRYSMGREYGSARVMFRDGSPPGWRVVVGTADTLEGAALLARKLQTEMGSGLVVRLDDPIGPK